MSCLLFCKDMFGRTIEICLNSEEMKNMTVEELKRRIEPGNEEELRLIFNGRQLEDGRTLATYGIQNESTLHVVQRLRGGGLPPEDEDKQMPRTASMEILAPMQTEPESNGSCWIL